MCRARVAKHAGRETRPVHQFAQAPGLQTSPRAGPEGRALRAEAAGRLERGRAGAPAAGPAAAPGLLRAKAPESGGHGRSARRSLGLETERRKDGFQIGIVRHAPGS